MRCIVLLFCPMASAQPIHIGAGDSVREGYRLDLFQDVPDQSHHILTISAHVLGLACGSFLFARFVQVPNDDPQRGALPASTRSRWKLNILQTPPQVPQRIAGLEPVFTFASHGSGQLFALVAPNLRVPGIPGEVSQRILSQASKPNV